MTEKETLLKKAEALGLKIVDGTTVDEIGAQIKDRKGFIRSDAQKRAWESRRKLFGDSGFKAGHGPRTAEKAA